MNTETHYKNDMKASHLFIITCTAMCVLFGIWAYFGQLDIVSMTDGRVIPATRVKSVQHLEGGIVRELFVSEGDRVKKGSPLVILEKTASDANVGELNVKINSLRADLARLAAESSGTASISFPDDLEKSDPDLVREANDVFRARLKTLDNEVARQKETILQKKQDISEIRVRLKNMKKSLDLLEDQVQISRNLLKDNLTSQYTHLSLLREMTSLQSSIEEESIALKRAESHLKEAVEKLKGIRHIFRKKSGEEQKEVRRKIDELSQRLGKYADTLDRSVIRAPVDGIVKALYIVTEGGVISPGMVIMDIVPEADRLVVEARLPISDIGYVAPGQTADIKLASVDARRFGRIKGNVVSVSPDAFITDQGRTFYNVSIETERDFFRNGRLEYRLYPGIIVKVFIHTGRRSVIEYLMDPFLNTLDNSLQER